MKKKLYVRLMLLAVGVAALMIGGQVVQAGVIGTAHDISSNGCASCHSVHNAIDVPLWGQTVTTETFTMYTGLDIQGTIAGTPNAESLLCLSCHDGVTTIDATSSVMTGSEVIGTNLAGSHPISITYTTATAAADGELEDPADDGNAGTGDNLPLFGANYELECSTCHDPHDNSNSPFLRVSNASSALCTSCHQK